ncbi:maleylpyruvate isomerase family mycothiol-dependent enzyme [Gulosibacter macacae]|uniref:Maleylpyruvate isomerase family mycothiol-dependent enzyme n=1 Tax=Gulosibacter macacae TaxID=2488791 RepID=A0A3P3W1D5_9MICO|nr:maleylpyruvate isomerase family mycothiol-dependent enzyme [Gulosibacter macacae]
MNERSPYFNEAGPGENNDFSRPANRVSGDWSAHIATTIDRLAALLEELDAEAWEAPSLCEGWRVRDVVGHLVWRLGASTGEMVRSGLGAGLAAGFNPNKAIDRIARQEAQASTEQLLASLRDIAASRLRGEGRTGIIELTEAIVHAYDITEALGESLRLSPRSTGAVALARLRTGGKDARIARTRSLRATDARWQIGAGAALDATAAEIVMHLFGRKPLG